MPHAPCANDLPSPLYSSPKTASFPLPASLPLKLCPLQREKKKAATSAARPKSMMPTATVLYDYEAQQADEVSADVGDVVEVIATEGQWCTV